MGTQTWIKKDERNAQVGALLLLLDSGVDLLEHAGVLRHTHSKQLVGTVVLVKLVVGVLLELLHVCSDEHLSKLNEVAVLLVVDLDDSPGVSTATDLAAIGTGDLVVGTNDGERNLGHDLVVLSDRLLVVELVTGTLKDLDTVVLDIGKNLYCNLLIGEGIGLGDNRDQVDLGVKSAHHLDVKRLEGVAGRLDKENTSMDTVVNNVHAVDLVLSIQVRVKSLLNVVDNRSP
ncbi:hypothetical protein HG531_003294 [Fusarium graminearum]|nr:hypothetical protein HG531_003294 [Fusarium graminearum]